MGVTEWPDGWNVTVDVGGKQAVYDPAYPTRDEALDKAREAAGVLRATFDPSAFGRAT